jgi:hypothetical protein
MKLIFESVDIPLQQIQFFLYVVMGYAVPESRVPFCFFQMMFDLVFQVMDVDELDVELVVKMFDADHYLTIRFPRGKIIQFAFQFIYLFTISYQLIVPLMTFIND